MCVAWEIRYTCGCTSPMTMALNCDGDCPAGYIPYDPSRDVNVPGTCGAHI